uniref:Protein-tyrosine phosphatase n=2 Tax=Parascaris univalens TaxID=6257 RepID=A0A914ZJK3_PARUN
MPFKKGFLRRVTIRMRHGLETSKQAAEEDGTQIERVDRTKKRKGATIRKGDSPEMIEQMRAFCLASARCGVQGLVQEFMEIKKSTPPPAQLKKTAFDKNTDKNRYKDVYCTDDTRVVLTYPPGCDNDYIHANWVDIRESKHKFICTQAPKTNTLVDFWRMVWQEKSKAIVMLCNIMECGKKKCEQYWPANVGETQTYGPITVKNLKNVQAEKMLTVSQLEVSSNSEPPLSVEHMFWNNWPDRGVPENYLACFRLLARLKNYTHIVVHCSAGIGRTGTVVGLEMAMQAFMAGEKLSMVDVVKELRRQRPGSVQTDVQYVYMHRCIIGLSENKKAVKREEMSSFMEQFDQLLKIRGCILAPNIPPTTMTARGAI